MRWKHARQKFHEFYFFQPLDRRLFFSTFDKDLYSLPVSALRDDSTTVSGGGGVRVRLVDRLVTHHGRRRSGADGMTADDAGRVYFGLLEKGSVMRKVIVTAFRFSKKRGFLLCKDY